MRRFQNILYVTRGTEDETDSLKQALSLARISVHHLRGRADRTLPRLVDDLQIDILVMGTVARAGIPGFVIGNTAENTLRAVRCSLLALKPNGFVSPVRAY